MKKFVRTVLVLAVIVYLVVTIRDLAPWAGKLQQVPPDHRCEVATDLEAPEDLALDPTSTTTPAILVAYTARRAAWEGKTPTRGGLARFYPLDGRVELIPDTLEGAFNTHGISVQNDADGVRVFAVNHRGEEDTVEIFRYDGKTLQHQRTIRDPTLVSLNDVAGAGGETFYATNDHRGRPGLAHKLEEFGRQRWSNVAYFDGQKARIVADGLRYGNGIVVDGDRVYASESTGKGLWVYRRGQNGDLTLENTSGLKTALDNLTVVNPGEVLIAAHPNLLDFLRHVGNGQHGSPSEVLRVKIAEDGAATSAAVEGPGFLVIGQVFEKGLVVCKPTAK